MKKKEFWVSRDACYSNEICLWEKKPTWTDVRYGADTFMYDTPYYRERRIYMSVRAFKRLYGFTPRRPSRKKITIAIKR